MIANEAPSGARFKSGTALMSPSLFLFLLAIFVQQIQGEAVTDNNDNVRILKFIVSVALVFCSILAFFIQMEK